MSEETKPTVIKIVSAKVTLEVDLGYVPFMKVIQQYTSKNKQVPFGMRDASRAKFDIFISAELGNDMTADELASQLSRQAYGICDRELRTAYPDSFKDAVKVEIPEEAFTIATTTIERVAEEF